MDMLLATLDLALSVRFIPNNNHNLDDSSNYYSTSFPVNRRLWTLLGTIGYLFRRYAVFYLFSKNRGDKKSIGNIFVTLTKD